MNSFQVNCPLPPAGLNSPGLQQHGCGHWSSRKWVKRQFVFTVAPMNRENWHPKHHRSRLSLKEQQAEFFLLKTNPQKMLLMSEDPQSQWKQNLLIIERLKRKADMWGTRVRTEATHGANSSSRQWWEGLGWQDRWQTGGGWNQQLVTSMIGILVGSDWGFRDPTDKTGICRRSLWYSQSAKGRNISPEAWTHQEEPVAVALKGLQVNAEPTNWKWRQ